MDAHSVLLQSIQWLPWLSTELQWAAYNESVAAFLPAIGGMEG